jgi:hypothetical protein
MNGGTDTWQSMLCGGTISLLTADGISLMGIDGNINRD